MWTYVHTGSITKVRELQNLVGPCCVVATASDLEAGPARELFCEWGSDERNSILFTDRGAQGTLQHRLLNEKPDKVMLRLWR